MRHSLSVLTLAYVQFTQFHSPDAAAAAGGDAGCDCDDEDAAAVLLLLLLWLEAAACNDCGDAWVVAARGR